MMEKEVQSRRTLVDDCRVSLSKVAGDVDDDSSGSDAGEDHDALSYLAHEITWQALHALSGYCRKPIVVEDKEIESKRVQKQIAKVRKSKNLPALDSDELKAVAESCIKEGREVKAKYAKERVLGRIAKSIESAKEIEDIIPEQVIQWYLDVDSHGRCEVHLADFVPLQSIKCIVFSGKPPNDLMHALEDLGLDYHVASTVEESANWQCRRAMGLEQHPSKEAMRGLLHAGPKPCAECGKMSTEGALGGAGHEGWYCKSCWDRWEQQDKDAKKKVHITKDKVDKEQKGAKAMAHTAEGKKDKKQKGPKAAKKDKAGAKLVLPPDDDGSLGHDALEDGMLEVTAPWAR